MAETVTRMQLAKYGDFKVNREQCTSTGQSGTKHDRRRLADVAFALTVASSWTTDKDCPIMDLLAAEITARTGKRL
jgi:hypothetical protein